MAWSNLTRDEAAQEYYSAKQNYANNAQNFYAARNAESNYQDEKRYANALMHSCRSDKLNFERRIEDIQNVISFLNGQGHGDSVPTVIQECTASANATDQSFHNSIQCEGIPAASIEKAFRSQTVEENANSSAALEEYKKELQKLIQKVEELNRKIATLTEQTENLNKQIAICQDQQSTYKKAMMTSAYEMNHFRKSM